MRLHTQWYSVYLHAAGLKDSFRRGIKHFQRAEDIDRRFAAAYSGLADCYAALGYLSFASPSEAFLATRVALPGIRPTLGPSPRSALPSVPLMTTMKIGAVLVGIVSGLPTKPPGYLAPGACAAISAFAVTTGVTKRYPCVGTAMIHVLPRLSISR